MLFAHARLFTRYATKETESALFSLISCVIFSAKSSTEVPEKKDSSEAFDFATTVCLCLHAWRETLQGRMSQECFVWKSLWETFHAPIYVLFKIHLMEVKSIPSHATRYHPPWTRTNMLVLVSANLWYPYKPDHVAYRAPHFQRFRAYLSTMSTIKYFSIHKQGQGASRYMYTHPLREADKCLFNDHARWRGTLSTATSYNADKHKDPSQSFVACPPIWHHPDIFLPGRAPLFCVGARGISYVSSACFIYLQKTMKRIKIILRAIMNIAWFAPTIHHEVRQPNDVGFKHEKLEWITQPGLKQTCS
jgi:hypothetical protein